MRINFSDVDAGGFDALPAGTYHVKVTDYEVRDSGPNAKHPDSQYVSWEFTVQRGEFEDRRLWDNTSFSHGECGCGDEETFNKALFKLMGLVIATGKYTEEEMREDDFELDFDDLVGADVKAVVAIRPYDGEDRNTIKRYKTISAEETASVLP